MISTLISKGFKFIKKHSYDYNHISLVFEYNDVCIVIDDDICKTDDTDNIFDYSKYCDVQNDLMRKYNRLYRFNHTDSIKTLLEDIAFWLNVDLSSIEITDSGGNFDKQHIDNTPLEAKFEEIFTSVYGNDAISYLAKEYSISVADKKNIFVDYVLETKTGSYAIEENGVTYHHPCILGNLKYGKQLYRQNILSSMDFKVFRFSTNNIVFKDQLADRLKNYLGEKYDFIPGSFIKNNRKYALYDFQKNILKNFDTLRRDNIKSALVVLPTASGKSQIIISDLEHLSINNKVRNVLILVSSIKIKEDWLERIKPLRNMEIDVLTYNAAFLLRNSVSKEHYDYIVFDEAHHAQAANCKKTIQYFNPNFLVGLTATPERLDNKKLEEIFGEYETGLSLREAIEKKIVSNIRMFRLMSNIDLSNVRYNGKDYNYSDLEKTLIIDSRNQLIAQIVKKYFSPQPGFYKQGLIFCVNKDHVKKLEKLLIDCGISARGVYGGNSRNDEYFNSYRNKEIQFLVSCQIISEGWDSPQTEVVVMARPTLSKVLYMQQIGRGLRNNPGKECLFVIDVVDSYTGKLIPWSVNALFKIPIYGEFMDVLKRTTDPLCIPGLVETEIALKEIDILTFEDKYSDYLSLEQAARELYVGTATLARWVNDNSNYASLYLAVGRRNIPYFSSEDIEKIRMDKDISIHNESTILNDFIEFIDDNQLTFSYKLIFLLNSFDLADLEGEIKIDNLVDKYRSFYLSRIERDIPVDRKTCPYTKDYLYDYNRIKRNMLENPFEKFERKRFIYYSKDLNLVAFNPLLWEKLTDDIKNDIITKLKQFLETYYEKLGGL